MQKQRVTVTLDEDLVEAIEEAVASGAAPSMSAFVQGAVADRVNRESLKALLSEIRSELGPATREETAWARSVLGR